MTLGQGQVNLLIQAASPPAGFGASSRGPDWWARQVSTAELEGLANITTLTQWRGHECEVLGVLDGDRILLSDDGADRAWVEANAQLREPGVWDVVAPRSELGAVREESTSMLTDR